MSTECLLFPPESVLPPELIGPPFRAAVVVESDVSREWQNEVSDWLVRSGCLYMMAWGNDCSSWDDSVDWANIEAFGFGEIPQDKFVMSTWHANEPLQEVFWFSKHHAVHPTVGIDRTLLIHISTENQMSGLLQGYADA